MKNPYNAFDKNSIHITIAESEFNEKSLMNNDITNKIIPILADIIQKYHCSINLIHVSITAVIVTVVDSESIIYKGSFTITIPNKFFSISGR